MSFPVEITPEAARQIQRLIQKDGRPLLFLRIGVKGGGCSGFEYVSKLDDVVRSDDLITEVEGVSIHLDPKSAKFLRGSKFVYAGSLMGGAFRFENPNEARSCGCGTSFTPRSATSAS